MAFFVHLNDNVIVPVTGVFGLKLYEVEFDVNFWILEVY